MLASSLDPVSLVIPILAASALFRRQEACSRGPGVVLDLP